MKSLYYQRIQEQNIDFQQDYEAQQLKTPKNISELNVGLFGNGV